MKKLLLLTTGGTIASTPTEEGLRPTAHGEGLLSLIGAVGCEVTVCDLLALDSSNIQPEEWQLIARSIFRERANYDGIVVTHGTDTMAYTASMLSFMLQNIDLPVVLTGSQLPIFHPLSDAPENLRVAFAMAQSGAPGVFVAFNRKVLLGCRAVKVRTTGFDAFESVNLPPVARVNAEGLVLDHALLPKRAPDAVCTLADELETRVALIKLIPGIEPALISSLAGLGCRGVVLEAFGSGGLAFLRRNLITATEQLVASGVAVVVCSQCLYERSDMTTYEVGRRALQKGVIPGEDMTSEAAVTKLMWALPRCQTPQQVAGLFAKDLAGELSPRAAAARR